MKGFLITRGVVIALLVLGYFSFKGLQNQLVELDETANGRWSEVQTQYQRRFDLIDNLVASVQSSAEFEQGTLIEVTKARASAFNAMNSSDGGRDLSGMEASENQLNVAMGGRGMRGMMMGYAEKYPDLKTTQQFADLMAQIEGTENRVAKARSDFNETIEGYNKVVKKFPMSLMAPMVGYHERDYFKSVEAAENAPSVRDSFDK